MTKDMANISVKSRPEVETATVIRYWQKAKSRLTDISSKPNLQFIRSQNMGNFTQQIKA
jgi:hypothetical protein